LKKTVTRAEGHIASLAGGQVHISSSVIDTQFNWTVTGALSS